MLTHPAPHPLIVRVVGIQERDGLSQVEMAARLGIERSVCSRLLAGKVQPTVRVIRAIAKAWPELRDACADVVLGEPEVSGATS